ncbi:hypothetical protein ACLOJK_013167 [Asimina triloba]
MDHAIIGPCGKGQYTDEGGIKLNRVVDSLCHRAPCDHSKASLFLQILWLDRSAMQHVLLLPFLALGHLLPFMSLAKLLAWKAGYMVTLITTPLNLQTLKSSPLPPPEEEGRISNLRFASLPFDSAAPRATPHPNVDNTDSIPLPLRIRHIKAADTLQPAFERLVSDICREDPRLPLCVVSGCSWAAARQFGIFHCFFFTSNACSICTLHFYADNAGSSSSTDLSRGPRFLQSMVMAAAATKGAAGRSDPSSQINLRRLKFLLDKSEGLLINTVGELEEEALQEIKRIWKRLKFLPASEEKRRALSGWINTLKTVLYVSFSTENSLHPRVMMELAQGLEDSGTRFIWIVRPPSGFNMKEEFRAEWLPEGFEHRMAEKKQGLLIRKWAPQLEILRHGSTGAYCGWNSTLESLHHGAPLVGWPIAMDQFLDSKLLEDMDVGVEIAKGSDAEISSAEIGR